MATAADAVDAALQRDPQGHGESRTGPTRFLFVSPLAVLYDVEESNQSVRVWAVWRPRRRR